MRNAAHWTSQALYSLLGLFLLWFGGLYASVHNMLWFHAAAVPEAAREAIRPLYFALMTLIGGASFALGALGLFVTWTGVRSGGRGAALAVSASYSVAFVTAAVTAEKLAAATGSPTSWHIMGVLIGLSTLAYGAHLLAQRRPAPANIVAMASR